MPVRAAVLGATGLVGQQFVRLLDGHPWVRVEALVADRSAGKTLEESGRWVLGERPPAYAAGMVLERLDVDSLARRVDVVFSALPRSVAGEVEPELARRGVVVVSNAGTMRMDPDVPLVNGEVNPGHLELVRVQRERRGWNGAIIKNPNCSTAVLTLFLKPLLDEYGLERVAVTTLQAMSGAGFSGLPSLAIYDNVIPYISREEEKIETESLKILGRLEGSSVKPADVSIKATATRVPVIDGHTEVVYFKLKRGPGSIDELASVLDGFRSLPQELGLPTAPEKPLIVRREEDRPQPRLDRMAGRGMSVTVGRLDSAPGLGEGWYRAVILGHNTIRGAAGAALLAFELFYKTGGMDGG